MKVIEFCSIVLLLSVIAACGAGSKNAAQLNGELHACDLLPAAEVSRIAGEAVANSTVGVENEVGADAMSQCTHSLADSGKMLNVQVRRSGKPIGQSKQAHADEARAQDDGTGASEELADAIESGEDIDGLGTLAYTYSFWDSLHLVVYWDKYYSVWLWMYSDPANMDEVLQIEKAAAQVVMNML